MPSRRGVAKLGACRIQQLDLLVPVFPSPIRNIGTRDPCASASVLLEHGCRAPDTGTDGVEKEPAL